MTCWRRVWQVMSIVRSKPCLWTWMQHLLATAGHPCLGCPSLLHVAPDFLWEAVEMDTQIGPAATINGAGLSSKTRSSFHTGPTRQMGFVPLKGWASPGSSGKGEHLVTFGTLGTLGKYWSEGSPLRSLKQCPWALLQVSHLPPFR